jgi:NOL1/NOP2/fmu family ribosome biogenesis protein
METSRETPPNRNFSSTHLEPLKKDVEIQIIDQIETNYGLDLEKVLEAHALKLFQRFDQLFLIPQKYTDHFITLPYEYIGMPLGQRHQNSLIPSHAFASRFGREFTRGKIVIEESHVGMWVSGRDIRHPQTEQTLEGQYLLVNDQDGRNLGLGKLLPKRLRNMLPRGLI